MEKTYKLVANITVDEEYYQDGDWVDSEQMFVDVTIIDSLIKKLQELRSQKESTIDGYWPPVGSHEDLEIVLEEGIHTE